MKRIGIYGGTFSPPHNGHVHAARNFFEKMQLDRLLIIPTYLPPHKQRTEQTSPEDRLSMCRLAFDFSDRIEISDIEIVRQGKSFTSDTLRALYEEDSRLYFLCGTDMFLTLESWHEPEVIFSLAAIVCVARENDPCVKRDIDRAAEEYRAKYNAEIHILPCEAIDVSSSEIRALRAQNGEWEQQLPAHVAGYIRERSLYL